MKDQTQTKKPVPPALLPFCYPKGTSGNPSGRPSKPKPVTLTKAYESQLSTIDPDTGESYAHGVAAKVLSLAIAGDIRAIMEVLSRDSEKRIKQVIDELVKNEDVSRNEAALALSLFTPGVSL